MEQLQEYQAMYIETEIGIYVITEIPNQEKGKELKKFLYSKNPIPWLIKLHKNKKHKVRYIDFLKLI